MRAPRDITRHKKDYLYLVGEIATTYANFERTICIWRLAAVDDITGECITSEILSWRPKIRILIALLHHAHASESLIKKVHKLNDSIQSVAAKRNKYIHGSCGLEIIDSELLPITKYATIKGSLKIDEIEYDPVRMRAIIDEINKLKQQAEAIMQGIFELQLQQ